MSEYKGAFCMQRWCKNQGDYSLMYEKTVFYKMEKQCNNKMYGTCGCTITSVRIHDHILGSVMFFLFENKNLNMFLVDNSINVLFWHQKSSLKNNLPLYWQNVVSFVKHTFLHQQCDSPILLYFFQISQHCVQQYLVKD